MNRKSKIIVMTKINTNPTEGVSTKTSVNETEMFDPKRIQGVKEKTENNFTPRHLFFQYRDLLWYFDVTDKDYSQMKEVWGEVDPSNQDGLQMISKSFKDYKGKDFETTIQHGLCHHFYHRGYFENQENDIFWLGITCGKDGLNKELHELQKDNPFSFMSWGKELKKITNQYELLNFLLEFYHQQTEEGREPVFQILKNLVSLPVLYLNTDTFLETLKSKSVEGKDKELLEELLYQSMFHLYSLKDDELRNDWFPNMKEDIEKYIDETFKNVMDFSTTSSYQHKRFLESNSVLLPMEQRLKKREELSEFFEVM